MSRKNQLCTLNLNAGAQIAAIPRSPATDTRAECPTRKRLSKAAARLRNIELVRNHRRDQEFGKAAEEQIIWRELLELEMQQTSERYGE